MELLYDFMTTDKLIHSKVHYITIDPDFSGQRIDNFLMTYLKSVPKTHVYRLLRKGEVRVNKKRIAVSYRLQAGDQLRIPPLKLADKKTPYQPGKRSLELLRDRVLYEDNDFLIVNKPSGIPVHGGSGVNMGVVEILRTLYPKCPHLELAHRLDADTSGCLVLAKKRRVLRELHALMREGKVHKAYLALTKGRWRREDCRVEVALVKNQLASGERIVKVHPEGKASLTVFNPVETFKKATLVEAILHTGRTHQIRVHARYRGHPIAGDEKYGDKEFNKTMRQLGLKRLFLHAHVIEFTLPESEKPIRVVAPLEEELAEFLTTQDKS